MSQEKIFVGYVKVEEIPMKSGGSFTKTRISFNDDHLKLLMSHLNENGYVNCNFNRSKSGNEYLEIDTWKPSVSYNPAPQQPTQAPQPQAPRSVNTPMPPPKPDFKVGDLVSYHSVIGGAITSGGHTIKSISMPPNNYGGAVAFISDKAGCVSLEALSKPKNMPPDFEIESEDDIPF